MFIVWTLSYIGMLLTGFIAGCTLTFYLYNDLFIGGRMHEIMSAPMPPPVPGTAYVPPMPAPEIIKPSSTL